MVALVAVTVTVDAAVLEAHVALLSSLPPRHPKLAADSAHPVPTYSVVSPDVAEAPEQVVTVSAPPRRAPGASAMATVALTYPSSARPVQVPVNIPYVAAVDAGTATDREPVLPEPLATSGGHVGDAVGVGVPVRLPVGVPVPLPVWLGEGVPEGVWLEEGVPVDVPLGEGVPVDVDVGDAPPLMLAVCEALGVGVPEGVWELEGVPVPVPVRVGVAVPVTDAVGVGGVYTQLSGMDVLVVAVVE